MSTSYTFAQNESISPHQLYRLYVFNLLGVGTLVLPNNLAKLGKYAFISIALGVFMAWLFMWIVSEVREQKKSIYDRKQLIQISWNIARHQKNFRETHMCA